MRYVAEVDGKTYMIDIDEVGDSLQLKINDQPVSADLRQVIAPTLFSLIKDGHSYEVFAEPTEKGYDVVISGERFVVNVADERSLRLARVQKRDVERRGDMVIKAPMPGLVAGVNVEPGDVVKAGQGLVILMAMKMENEIRAFERGTVKTIAVKKGDKVELGQTLLTIG
jgi:biotin carboxyl carrier protein